MQFSGRGSCGVGLLPFGSDCEIHREPVPLASRATNVNKEGIALTRRFRQGRSSGFSIISSKLANHIRGCDRTQHPRHPRLLPRRILCRMAALAGSGTRIGLLRIGPASRRRNHPPLFTDDLQRTLTQAIANRIPLLIRHSSGCRESVQIVEHRLRIGNRSLALATLRLQDRHRGQQQWIFGIEPQRLLAVIDRRRQIVHLHRRFGRGFQHLRQKPRIRILSQELRRQRPAHQRSGFPINLQIKLTLRSSFHLIQHAGDFAILLVDNRVQILASQNRNAQEYQQTAHITSFWPPRELR